MEQHQEKKWYDNKLVVTLLCIVFFPVGLYALWKSNTISQGWKIGVTIVIALFVVIGVSNEDDNVSSTDTVTASSQPEKELTQAQKDSIAKVERAEKIEKRKESTISANNLVAAYKNNEIAADKNYEGKTFYVEGYIDNIGNDILDNAYVTLKSRDAIRSVQCYVDDKETLANLRKGQRITVKGDCDGLMMNVQMKNCEVVQNVENL
jgi:hypothetical protein